MDLRQRYLEVYEALDSVIQEKIAKGKLSALGYTSNLDLLCDFKVERLNELLETHFPDGCLTEMKAAKEINTMKDLLESMVYYCINGIGGEVDIVNTKLAEESFPFTYGMGGTGAQAALALNEVGCPSLLHLTDDSKEVCDILNTPCVYTVSQDGELIHTDKVTQTQEQEPHYIIQFKKGDVVRLGEQEIAIPCSNRLILTKVTVNEFVPLSEAYLRWIEEHADLVPSNVLSSLNCVQSLDVCKERVDALIDHVTKYHANNPNGVAFFEDAHYHDVEMKKYCLANLYSHIDVIGLNEEELNYTLNLMYNYHVDIEDIFSCVEGALYLKEKLGVRKGVLIHTKDYSMYVGEDLGVDIQSGLMYGNLLATAKATNGWYGNREQVKEVLGYELSEKGEKHYNEIAQSKYADLVVLVPSKYMDKPKYTIGLGDSFLGGVQMCF